MNRPIRESSYVKLVNCLWTDGLFPQASTLVVDYQPVSWPSESRGACAPVMAMRALHGSAIPSDVSCVRDVEASACYESFTALKAVDRTLLGVCQTYVSRAPLMKAILKFDSIKASNVQHRLLLPTSLQDSAPSWWTVSHGSG